MPKNRPLDVSKIAVGEYVKRELEFYTVKAMEIYGGSFVKCLSECFNHADPINFIRLKNAFPEYWKEYEKMGKDLIRNKLKCQKEKK